MCGQNPYGYFADQCYSARYFLRINSLDAACSYRFHKPKYRRKISGQWKEKTMKLFCCGEILDPLFLQLFDSDIALHHFCKRAKPIFGKIRVYRSIIRNFEAYFNINIDRSILLVFPIEYLVGQTAVYPSLIG